MSELCKIVIVRIQQDGIEDGCKNHRGFGLAHYVLKGSSVTDEIQDIRFLGRDYAIVVSRAGILFAGEADVPAGRLVNATWVLQRRDDRWLVAAYHNSPVEAS